MFGITAQVKVSELCRAICDVNARGSAALPAAALACQIHAALRPKVVRGTSAPETVRAESEFTSAEVCKELLEKITKFSVGYLCDAVSGQNAPEAYSK